MTIPRIIDSVYVPSEAVFRRSAEAYLNGVTNAVERYRAAFNGVLSDDEVSDDKEEPFKLGAKNVRDFIPGYLDALVRDAGLITVVNIVLYVPTDEISAKAITTAARVRDYISDNRVTRITTTEYNDRIGVQIRFSDSVSWQLSYEPDLQGLVSFVETVVARLQTGIQPTNYTVDGVVILENGVLRHANFPNGLPESTP